MRFEADQIPYVENIWTEGQEKAEISLGIWDDLTMPCNHPQQLRFQSMTPVKTGTK